MVEHQILEVRHVAGDDVHHEIVRPGHQKGEPYLGNLDDFGQETVDQVGRASCRERVYSNV